MTGRRRSLGRGGYGGYWQGGMSQTQKCSRGVEDVQDVQDICQIYVSMAILLLNEFCCIACKLMSAFFWTVEVLFALYIQLQTYMITQIYKICPFQWNAFLERLLFSCFICSTAKVHVNDHTYKNMPLLMEFISWTVVCYFIYMFNG